MMIQTTPRFASMNAETAFTVIPRSTSRAVDHVFRNDRGRFVDVTQTAGFTDPNGHGLGVVAADIDDDNRIDLFVANDGTANFLFLNKGGFQFEDNALVAGVAGSAQGGYQAGMGVAAGDLDGDGRMDLLVTNLYLEGTTLYHNLGRGMFADHSAVIGDSPCHAVPAGIRHRSDRCDQRRPARRRDHQRQHE